MMGFSHLGRHDLNCFLSFEWWNVLIRKKKHLDNLKKSFKEGYFQSYGIIRVADGLKRITKHNV